MGRKEDMQTLAEIFRKLRFKKNLLGGLNEADVWAKLEKIQKLYQTIYDRRETELLAIIADRENMIRQMDGVGVLIPDEPLPKLSEADGEPQRESAARTPPDDGAHTTSAPAAMTTADGSVSVAIRSARAEGPPDG